MPTVGEQLRNARERQKLQLSDIAETTKIRSDHLRALETGDYSMFSAAVYIRGFVKTYAALLKLDVPPLLAQLDSELAATKEHRQMPSLVPRSNPLEPILAWFSKLNWKWAAAFAGALLILVIAFFAIRAWRRAASADPLQNLGPGIYQPDPTNLGLTLPLPSTNK